MLKFGFSFTFFISCLGLFTAHSQHVSIANYYKKISKREFLKYDSSIIVLRSKYGKVYQSFEKDPSGFELNFYVFEQVVNGLPKSLFKMDELTQIRDDSTFMLCDPPLKVTSDTINWVNGVWFYKVSKSQESLFSVDSIPPNLTIIDYKALNMGVYQFKGSQLIKVLNNQAEKEFYDLNLNGFFYLPNPGFFYRLARLDEIR